MPYWAESDWVNNHRFNDYFGQEGEVEQPNFKAVCNLIEAFWNGTGDGDVATLIADEQSFHAIVSHAMDEDAAKLVATLQANRRAAFWKRVFVKRCRAMEDLLKQRYSMIESLRSGHPPWTRADYGRWQCCALYLLNMAFGQARICDLVLREWLPADVRTGDFGVIMESALVANRVIDSLRDIEVERTPVLNGNGFEIKLNVMLENLEMKGSA